jgi:hypothetical protein
VIDWRQCVGRGCRLVPWRLSALVPVRTRAGTAVGTATVRPVVHFQNTALAMGGWPAAPLPAGGLGLIVWGDAKRLLGCPRLGLAWLGKVLAWAAGFASAVARSTPHTHCRCSPREPRVGATRVGECRSALPTANQDAVLQFHTHRSNRAGRWHAWPSLPIHTPVPPPTSEMNSSVDNDHAWVSALSNVAEERFSSALVELFEFAQRFTESHSVAGRKCRIVLVSRRLSCLYEMACRARMPPFDLNKECEVVYDRALDGNPSWAGVPTLVLDDVLVYGSTVRDRVDEIRLHVDSQLITSRVAMMCEGADRKITNALWPNEPIDEATGLPSFAVVCTAKEAEAFAKDVAVCLYRSMTPYLTDFPIVDKASISSEDLERLLRTTRWMTADVTLVPIAREGQAAYTFIPNPEVREAILSRIDSRAAELAKLMKIRVFVGPPSDGRRDMRIVPIGIPGPAVPEDLQEVLSTLRQDLKIDLDARSWKPEAKHRLVQMYLSTAVLTEFWDDLASALGDRAPVLSSGLLDHLHIRSYFERERFDQILHAFDAVVTAYRDTTAGDRAGVEPHFFAVHPTSPPLRLPEIVSEIARAGWQSSRAETQTILSAPPRPSTGETSVVSIPWAQQALNLWAVVVDKYQVPAQNALAKASAQASADTVDGDDDSVEAADDARYSALRRGFLLSDLADLMFPWVDPNDPWEASLASLVLDVGNDLGIAVPSTHYEGRNGAGRAVFRQYRAGENAPVARAGVDDLAFLDPEKTFENLDAMLHWWVHGLDRKDWDELDAEQRGRVARLGEAKSEVSTATTLGGQVQVVRVFTVEKDYGDRIVGFVDAVTYGGAGERAELTKSAVLNDSVFAEKDLLPGRSLFWYTVALRRGGFAHRFDRFIHR